MNLKILPEHIMEFLDDENLGPYHFKQKNDAWTIQICEPWGTNDTKFRLGITTKILDGKEVVVFNSFKSVANLGDEYKGNFYNFVKLIKDFTSFAEAKNYFMSKYLFNATEEIDFNEDVKIYTQTKSLDFPDTFEKLDIENPKHEIFINYLTERKFPLNKFKIFVDVKDYRIVFPVYEQGKLIFYTARATYKTPLTWKKSVGDNIFPIWNLENTEINLIILEGIFDAGMVPNGVALLGTVFNESIREKILNKCFQKIIVVMDNDLPGNKAKLRIAKELDSYHKNVFVYMYESKYKDFNEMVYNGEKINLAKNCQRFNLQAELQITQEINKFEKMFRETNIKE